MTSFETTDRFLRPDDLKLIRRNRRQMQMERVLAVTGRLCTASLLLLLAYWIFEKSRQDGRFAVRSIELEGARHSSAQDLDRVMGAYRGVNLFSLDIAAVETELRKLPWIERVAIEKKLPSTLKITLMERRPVALATVDGTARYVDERGRPFADLSPAIGNPDLPVVSGAAPHQIADCVRLLLALQKADPALYSRISEIGPVGEAAFRVFDRDLKTFIYLDGLGAAKKWRALYALAGPEGYRHTPAEYVDLRFANRIIVKPRRTENRKPTTGASR